MRLGYRTAVQLLFIALLVLTVTVVAATGYRQARTGVITLGVAVIDAAMLQIQERGEIVLKTAEHQLALLGLTIRDQDWHTKAEPILNYLWELNRQSPLYQSTFIADLNGGMLQARSYPNPATRVLNNAQPNAEIWTYRSVDFKPLTQVVRPSDYDPRNRPWFQQTDAHSGRQVTDVYAHSVTQEPGITISYPLTNSKGELQGVAGIDIGLTALNDFITSITPSEDLVFMIINDLGQIIAYPHGHFTLPASNETGPITTVADLRQAWINEAWAKLAASESSAENQSRRAVQLSSGRYFLRKKQITSGFENEWHLLVMIPEYAVLASVNRGLYSSIMLAIIMQIIAAYIIFITATQLTKPLKQMVTNAKMLEELRSKDLRPVNSPFVEFIVLDHSIQKMKGSLLAFNRYVPTTLVRRLLTEQPELTLGGEARSMVIMNTGINGFSSIGRAMPAPEQANYLTRYQQEIFEAVSRNTGSVDKFIDDRIISFWGAPDADPSDIYNACNAALESQKAITQLNHILRRDGLPSMGLRVGLHSDLCVVGNFGSEERMFYSVIGAAVSVSLWLCNLNKQFGTQIIASDKVQNQVPRDFIWRRLDRVLMYDQKSILDIFELVGLISDPDAVAQEEMIHRYERALTLRYERDDPEAALEAFQDLAEQYPHDLPIARQIAALTSSSQESSHEHF